MRVHITKYIFHFWLFVFLLILRLLFWFFPLQNHDRLAFCLLKFCLELVSKISKQLIELASGVKMFRHGLCEWGKNRMSAYSCQWLVPVHVVCDWFIQCNSTHTPLQIETKRFDHAVKGFISCSNWILDVLLIKNYHINFNFLKKLMAHVWHSSKPASICQIEQSSSAE